LKEFDNLLNERLKDISVGPLEEEGTEIELRHQREND
jgi:hypothetical protein